MSKPFQFFLRKNATTYLTVSGGVVVETPTPTPLQYAPDGWANIEQGFSRNTNKHGIISQYSNAYRFVEDGAYILRHTYFTSGVGAQCQLEIKRRNHTTDLYDPYMVGDFDFTTARDEKSFFSVTLMEGGLIAMLKAYESVEFEIPLSDLDPDLIRIKLASLRAKGEATWITVFPPTERSGFPHTAYPPYVDINEYPFIAMSSVDVRQVLSPTNVLPINPGNQAVASDNDYVLKTFTTLHEVRFEGKLSFSVNNASGTPTTFHLRWNISTGGSSVQHIVFNGTVAASSVTTFSNVDVAIPTGPITIPAGSVVTLLANMPGSTTIAWDYSWIEGSQIKASWLNYTPEFIVKGFRYWTVLSKLIAKISGGLYTASSLLLTNSAASYGSGFDNRPWDSIVTSGDGIRGKSDAVLKITLADLFKDADVRWSVGMDTSSTVVSMESKSSYYDYTNDPIYLGPAAKVVIDTDEEFVFTHMKIGYEPQTYDEVNGRDEVNTTQGYKFPIKTKSQEFNLVSRWRSDQWGIFFTWMKYVLSDSKDSDSDNSIFVVEVNPNPNIDGFYTPLSLPQNSPTTGISDPAKSFNFGFSPKRNLYRNGAYIHSLLYGHDGEHITYQSTDKNSKLQSDLVAGLIREDSNVLIGSLPPPLFLNFSFHVDIATDEDLAATILAFPYREYFTDYEGRTYRGFIMVGAVKGAKRDKFTFKLRASRNTDMGALIRRR